MSPLFRRQEAVVPEPAEFEPDALTVGPELPEAAEAVTQYPIGGREYFILAPEVQRMVGYSKATNANGILSLMRGTTVQTINQKIDQSNMDRRTKRAMINSGLGVRAVGAAQALAQLMTEPGSYETGSVQDRYGLATAALAPYRGRISKLISEDVIYHDIYQAAGNLEKDLLIYRTRSESLGARLAADLADNPGARYELAKLVAGTGGFSDTDDAQLSDEKNARQWLVKLLNSPYENNGRVLRTVAKEAQEGGFDQHLALELMEGAGPSNPAINNMLMLAGINGGANEEAYVRLAAAVGHWPKEAVALLTDAREELVNAMRLACEGAKADLAAKLGLVSDGLTSAERFNKMMEKMIDTVWGVSRAALANAPPEVKKKLLSPATPAVKQTVVYRATPEIRREINNSIKFVDKSGRIFENGSPEYDEMIQQALGRYKGTKEFPTDIMAAIEYISHIDFARPTGRVGLDKINSGDWTVEMPDGPKPRPLYRFKAQTAVGIPIKTQVMKDHRIMFALIDNNTVGLVGIVPRRDLNDFLKRAGINTAAK